MNIVESGGNTPLTDVPPDYHPAGAAYWLVLERGPDAGKKLFFTDHVYGEGEPQHTVVFVHGNPESSYTWRHVIRHLVHQPKSAIRVIAMDHIGFGLSDQADFEMVDMHHAANLRELIGALDLQDVTLVVHDWGGPIGIGAFLEEPGRVSKLVVVNSTVFPIPGDGMTYTNYPLPRGFAWADMPNRVPARLWGAHAAFAIRAMPEGRVALALRYLSYVSSRSLLPMAMLDPEERVWIQQFRPSMNARSSKRMVRQTPVWGHGYRYTDARHGEQDNHAFYQRIQQRIGKDWKDIHARGVFGDWDPLAKASVRKQWSDALPQMQIRLLAGMSHFVEEHESTPIVDAILA